MHIYTPELYFYAILKQPVRTSCAAPLSANPFLASAAQFTPPMQTKDKRHTLIRELLERSAVTSQDQLRHKLAGRGINVTQATLSRDIRELKLNKGPEGYALPNGTAELDGELPGIAEIFGSFALGVQQAQNQVVVHTITGGAPPVAAAIDEEEWQDVVGTIAGDDTVLVICPNSRSATLLQTRIEAYLA